MSPHAPHELLAINLRRLTEIGGIPLTVLADKAGIDRAELFAAMTGEYDPDLTWLRRLANALAVPLFVLFEEPRAKPR